MILFVHDNGANLAKSAALCWRARFPIHQCSGACGGTFTCAGCNRVVGWCMGSGDDLGAEHCDDCYKDRLAVLYVLKTRQHSRHELRIGAKRQVWQRDPVAVAEELVDDGFMVFNGAGRFALSERGKSLL